MNKDEITSALLESHGDGRIIGQGHLPDGLIIELMISTADGYPFGASVFCKRCRANFMLENATAERESKPNFEIGESEEAELTHTCEVRVRLN